MFPTKAECGCQKDKRRQGKERKGKERKQNKRGGEKRAAWNVALVNLSVNETAAAVAAYAMTVRRLVTGRRELREHWVCVCVCAAQEERRMSRGQCSLHCSNGVSFPVCLVMSCTEVRELAAGGGCKQTKKGLRPEMVGWKRCFACVNPLA